MKLTRLKVSHEVSTRLVHLKGRTGLTPNILCRIGFCLSLNDPTIPNPDDYPPDTDKEIDRHTLTGSWDLLFVAMIKERCNADGLGTGDEMLASQFRAHVNRGVLLLYKRTRSLSDLALLLPQASGMAMLPIEADNGTDLP
jgi:DNA sulfur modification protein DndE